jgi:hypothetical protein
VSFPGAKIAKLSPGRRQVELLSLFHRDSFTLHFAMDSPADYLHLGFILMSYPNLIVIGLMILLFVVALVAPFHGVGGGEDQR